MLNRLSLNKLSLNRIDLNRIGGRDVGVSARPYIDPELLSHVKMAISTWGKSNDDPDRTVLKDLSGNGNDMRLLNFGFAGNSGYGLYSTDFTKWTKRQINDLEVSPNKISVSNKDSETALVIWLDVNKNRYVIPSYKIKVSKLTKTITYYYIDEANPSIRSTFSINKEGTYILPISRNDLYNGEENTNIGFGIFPHESFTIEQLPDFEGWLCTDGVDDMIVSEKTVDEMIGDSKECTVISIINYISDIGSNHVNIFGERFIRNMFEKNDINGKYYICGYTSTNIDEIGNVTVVNDILGDKNDFVASYPIASGVADYFSVTGYLDTNNVPQKCAKIAYAGGFIANKALTADEINQIIAYFNLDRPGQIIKPQLYCNVKKQGITNDNHAEFNDQLIDFVGGHNIQLNNVAWEGESGINSYPVVFGANKTWETYAIYNFTGNINGNKLHITHIEHANNGFLFSYVKREGQILNKKEIPSFKIKISGLEGDSKLLYLYLKTENATGGSSLSVGNGVHELPKSFIPTESLQSNIWVGFTISSAQEGVSNFDCDITLEVLPTIENALCLDGINDFGKVTGLPVLKDYTVVADREIETINGGIISKSYSIGNGAFIFELTGSAYSFGNANVQNNIKGRMISYMSKYSYNGNSITPGTGIDGDTMWLATIRDNYINFSKLALWPLMLFPYSLSEFLLERQLRKYKAGTLYPDMIEFRPIVKSNIPYLRILYFITSTGDQIIKGSYIPIGSVIQINIQTVNATDEISSVSVNGKEVDMYNKDETYWRYRFKVTKSPQKINIVISSYLTTLGNETLISNETLIKNE